MLGLFTVVEGCQFVRLRVRVRMRWARTRELNLSESLCEWRFWSFRIGNPTAVLLYRLFSHQKIAVLSFRFSSFFTSFMSIDTSVSAPAAFIDNACCSAIRS